MNSTLNNRLFVSFAIGFCFILFNSTALASDNDSIQQQQHSGLESPEKAFKDKKTPTSNQSLLKRRLLLLPLQIA